MESSLLMLRPAGKDYLWGGSRLNDDFSKGIGMDPLAETWECSTHPDGPAYVFGGEYDGMTLKEVLSKHPEYMGRHARPDGDIPILIKLIDAKRPLSVQVHPSDEYAMKNENGQRGKTEMWYVLGAKKSANLVHGFAIDVNPRIIRESINNGTIEKYLQKVPVKKDDVLIIHPGTVHAIGEEVLIAEIQENSNITYRLYDYNRTDKNGIKRKLDVEKAIDVLNMKSSEPPRQPMRVLRYKPGIASELLCRCRYFQTERLLINTERCREMAVMTSKKDTFQVLLCVDGCGIIYEDNCIISFFAGDCIFVTAGDMKQIKFHGKATILRVSC